METWGTHFSVIKTESGFFVIVVHTYASRASLLPYISTTHSYTVIHGIAFLYSQSLVKDKGSFNSSLSAARLVAVPGYYAKLTSSRLYHQQLGLARIV